MKPNGANPSGPRCYKLCGNPPLSVSQNWRLKKSEKTAWIVARYEVFWPTLKLEQGSVLTKPRSGAFSIANGRHPLPSATDSR